MSEMVTGAFPVVTRAEDEATLSSQKYWDAHAKKHVEIGYTDDTDPNPTDEAFLSGKTWAPSGELLTQKLHAAPSTKGIGNLPSLRPSQFVSRAMWMPRDDGKGYERFSFEGRRHMYAPYDSPAQRILLCCARQVEKSTLLGNLILATMCLIPSYRWLLVAPSATQAKTFSHDRLREPIETSPFLSAVTRSMLSRNILEKQFINRSKVTLRYAFLNADRTRGIPAYGLALDEIQDFISDNIPVIEQCTAHAPDHYKRFVYSGTPKSLDNPIEVRRAEQSTQGEWAVPCFSCNTWNDRLDERNIGKHGLICRKCGKAIHPQDPRSQWVAHVKWDPVHAPFESFRIPQLMVPWKLKNWGEILYAKENYSRSKFYNEVLGISSEAGQRPLTKNALMAACNAKISMTKLEEYRSQLLGPNPWYMGVDWGTGDVSYTVATLGTYINMKFQVLFQKRFYGTEAEAETMLQAILEMATFFGVKRVGMDWGFGFGLNSRVMRTLGANRAHQFQYVGQSSKAVSYEPDARLFRVNRTAVMSAFFDAIKDKKVLFPDWEEWRRPHGQDFLNIHSEHDEKRNTVKYDHLPGNPDDSYHSFAMCFLASMLDVPRPDIIRPDANQNQGPQQREWTTTYQG